MKRKLMVFHQYLAPYRIDFFNALARRGDMEAFFEYEDSPDHHYNRREMESRCVFRPRYLNHVPVAGRRIPSGLACILREGRPDLVLVPEFSILALEVCLLRAVFRWKFQIISICDDSMDMIRGNELSRLHALARKMAMPMIDDVILPDSEACRWYREHYGKGIFFPIVRDEQAFRMQCREALPVSLSLQEEYALRGKKVVLYVGRLAPEKNLECLVRAAASLPEDTVLVIVGSGSLKEELQHLAGRMQVSAIFPGWLEGVRLAAWYNLADIFVLPSLVEPFGAVVNDALAAGCFCLVSGRCGSSCLIRQGWNGELFDPEDEERLASLL
ncbi:MAG: glycosyltransferase family 4 protein, partial [Akkermansia sp.]